MITIPVEPQLAFQSMDCSVEGYPFKLRAHWNSRAGVDPVTGIARGGWFLDFLEDDGSIITTGCAAVIGTFIGRASNHSLFRRGVFVVEDTGGGRVDAGFDDFGTRVQLRYYTSGDIMANIIARYQARGIGI